MKSFKLEIKLGNAAFEDDPSTEIARILTTFAREIDGCGGLSDYDGHALIDINGNTVGQVAIK